jgi:acetyltransferase-like isoleucine patch superfamily enzyme
MSDAEVYVHPHGLCESDAIGAGTRVWAFAHVMAGAVIGERCNVGGGAFIESGAVIGDGVTIKNNVLVWVRVTIEDDVFLGPNAVFTNDLDPRAAYRKDDEEFLATVVRRGATIGANATIVCGNEIGAGAFVGAGTVVISDVPAHAVVVGNPARRIGWMCVCGALLEYMPAAFGLCGRRYRPDGDGLALQDGEG